jgi:hypothetical protein
MTTHVKQRNQPTTHRIKLTWDFDHKVQDKPNIPKLKGGDKIEFYADPPSTVDVELLPSEAFEPARFKTGDPPVLVKKDSDGKTKIWCGGQFFDDRPGRHPLIVGVNPKDVNATDHKWGSVPDTN